MDPTALRIGELAEQTGCKVETIRYYESVGVLPAPARNDGGHRRYTIEHLKRLNFVRRARSLGFSLAGVRNLLHLADERGQSCAEVEGLARAHRNEIQEKIKDLRAMEKVLKYMVDSCAGGTLPDCPIIETLFREMPEGSGGLRGAAATGRKIP